jgi:hypothetical protein
LSLFRRCRCSSFDELFISRAGTIAGCAVKLRSASAGRFSWIAGGGGGNLGSLLTEQPGATLLLESETLAFDIEVLEWWQPVEDGGG